MRTLVTSLFEAVGLLLLVAAGGLAVAAWSVPAGLAAGGLLLLGASALIAWREPAERR